MWPDEMVIGLKEEVERLHALKEAAYRLADEVHTEDEPSYGGITLVCNEVARLREFEANREQRAKLGLPCGDGNFCGEDCDMLKWERGRADRLADALYGEKRV